MGCCGDREKGSPEESAKWDFITLSDFRCTSAWTVVAYGWLWFLAFIAIAVYVVDTYTAVNLLAFNEWNSQVQPKLAFKYSKWIFAVCILLSWALLFYELIRAIRVIRRGGVAESFLDPLAVDIQSIRRRGFKRFLVFAELTKSKKGADYVALFVYFSFKGAIRIILAEGPRQAVNAMTLYALLTAELMGNHSHERNNFDQFWWNVAQIWDKDQREAIIYFTMLFTFVIWVFSAICLIIAAILYIVFLWHYIPQRDGRLSTYCKRKIDRRLAKIVEHKVKAAIEEEERKTQKAARKAELKAQKTGEMPPPVAPYLKKQPTLPSLGDSPDLEKKGADTLPEFPLVRQDTSNSTTTLPPYSGNDNSRMTRQPTLPQIDTSHRRQVPTRTATHGSQWSDAPSYRSEAPLLANAGYAGGPEDVALPLSALTQQSFNAPFHRPMGSQGSMGSVRSGQVRHFTPGPGSRVQTPVSANPFGPGPQNGSMYPRQPPQPRFPLPVRSNTGMSYEQDPNSALTFASSQDAYRSHGPPMRSNTADGFHQPPPPPPPPQQSQGSFVAPHSQNSFSRPMPRNPANQNFTRAYTPATVSEDRSASPHSYEMHQSPTHIQPPPPPKDSSYVAFNPSAYSAAPAPQASPRRNVTVTHGAPASGTGDYFRQVPHGVPQRSATAPITPMEPQRASVGDILDDYGSSEEDGIYRPQAPHVGPPRSNTAGPANHGQWRAY